MKKLIVFMLLISSCSYSFAQRILVTDTVRIKGIGIGEFSGDTSLGTSNTKLPTQNAVKKYVDRNDLDTAFAANDTTFRIRLKSGKSYDVPFQDLILTQDANLPLQYVNGVLNIPPGNVDLSNYATRTSLDSLFAETMKVYASSGHTHTEYVEGSFKSNDSVFNVYEDRIEFSHKDSSGGGGGNAIRLGIEDNTTPVGVDRTTSLSGRNFTLQDLNEFKLLAHGNGYSLSYLSGALLITDTLGRRITTRPGLLRVESNAGLVGEYMAGVIGLGDDNGYLELSTEDGMNDQYQQVFQKKSGTIALLSDIPGGGGGGTSLNGIGFVKANGTTISYDNNSYVPTTRTVSFLGTSYPLSSDITLPTPTLQQVLSAGANINGTNIVTVVTGDLYFNRNTSNPGGFIFDFSAGSFNSPNNSMRADGSLQVGHRTNGATSFIQFGRNRMAFFTAGVNGDNAHFLNYDSSGAFYPGMTDNTNNTFDSYGSAGVLTKADLGKSDRHWRNVYADTVRGNVFVGVGGGGGGTTLNGTGIPVMSGTSVSVYIPDNSTNWNTAFTHVSNTSNPHAVTLQQATSAGGTTNTDIEITDATKGVILKSPNGTRYRITANNDGSLTTTAL